MAIDTENRRRSAMSSLWGTVMPVPDGDIGVEDRPHVVWLYSGILIGAAVIPAQVRYAARIIEVLRYRARIT